MRRTGTWWLVGATLLGLCLTVDGATGMPTARADTFDVSVLDNAYSPEPMTIAPGTTVVWTNRGRVPHTVTSDTGSGEVFDSNTLAPGRSFSHTFNRAGVFTYHCAFHDTMLGTIVVEQPSAAPGPGATSSPTPAFVAPRRHTTVAVTALDGVYRFTPETLKVKVGAQVVWQNASEVPHDVTSDTRGWSFRKSLGLHGVVRVRFTRPGTYRYHCSIHPGMAGKIVVHR